VRGKWRFEPNDLWRVDLTVLRAQIDNGYDAFAIDNSRTTQSDHPSVDRQYSTGLSGAIDVLRIGTCNAHHHRHVCGHEGQLRFDSDWGNPKLWAPYTDDFTEYQVRYRSTRSLEIRLSDTPTRKRRTAFPGSSGSMALSCASR